MLYTCRTCGAASEQRYCPSHRGERRGTWGGKHGTRSSGSTRAWRKARAQVLRGNPSCFYCAAPATHADHLHPAEHGGSDDPANLVPACAPCNRIKGDHALEPTPTIAIVGPAASGKTTLARALHGHAGWQVLAIDDYRECGQSWDHLIADLVRMTARHEPAIVESMALPHRYRVQLIVRRALLVTVGVPEPIRQDRLRDRPADFPRDRRWDDARICHHVVDGTRLPTPELLTTLVLAATDRMSIAPSAAMRSRPLRLA